MDGFGNDEQKNSIHKGPDLLLFAGLKLTVEVPKFNRWPLRRLPAYSVGREKLLPKLAWVAALPLRCFPSLA